MRKNQQPKRRSVEANGEVPEPQNSIDLLIPRTRFERLANEILMSRATGLRFSQRAIEALQESSEMFLTQLFEDAWLLSIHRRQQSLETNDTALTE